LFKQRNKIFTEVERQTDRQTRHKGTPVSAAVHALVPNAETTLQ